jgi:hypothetical protein
MHVHPEQMNSGWCIVFWISAGKFLLENPGIDPLRPQTKHPAINRSGLSP